MRLRSRGRLPVNGHTQDSEEEIWQSFERKLHTPSFYWPPDRPSNPIQGYSEMRICSIDSRAASPPITWRARSPYTFRFRSDCFPHTPVPAVSTWDATSSETLA